MSAIRSRQLVVTPEARFGFEMLGIPKIDVRSVGAGGGSLAWVDAGGLLRVGPQSAGARPGPACYGLGGTEATVTDANVVLGIIDPDYYLGAKIKLDRGKAEAAVAKIAAKLRLPLHDAAYAIYTMCNHNMIAAIEDITVKKGIDPRESYVVSGGGATGCHIGEMSKLLGIGHFMIPRFAAGLSAYGELISDVRWEEKGTLHTTDRDFDRRKVNALLKRLIAGGHAFRKRADVPVRQRRFEFSFQARYLYQSCDIDMPFTMADGKFPKRIPPVLLRQSMPCTSAFIRSRMRPISSNSSPGKSWQSAAQGVEFAKEGHSPPDAGARRQVAPQCLSGTRQPA